MKAFSTIADTSCTFDHRGVVSFLDPLSMNFSFKFEISSSLNESFLVTFLPSLVDLLNPISKGGTAPREGNNKGALKHDDLVNSTFFSSSRLIAAHSIKNVLI